MQSTTNITTLFLDIGNVLLTNGWGHESRQRAAEKFNIDYTNFNNRHAIAFETYELGKLTMDEYLDIAVFNKPRDFTKEEFRQFMFIQSKSFPQLMFISENQMLIFTNWRLISANQNQRKHFVLMM